MKIIQILLLIAIGLNSSVITIDKYLQNIFKGSLNIDKIEKVKDSDDLYRVLIKNSKYNYSPLLISPKNDLIVDIEKGQVLKGSTMEFFMIEDQVKLEINIKKKFLKKVNNMYIKKKLLTVGVDKNTINNNKKHDVYIFISPSCPVCKNTLKLLDVNSINYKLLSDNFDNNKTFSKEHIRVVKSVKSILKLYTVPVILIYDINSNTFIDVIFNINDNTMKQIVKNEK
jgi:glutaredoxin